MRRHLAIQAMESGKAWYPGMVGAPAYGAYGNGAMNLNTDVATGKVGKSWSCLDMFLRRVLTVPSDSTL